MPTPTITRFADGISAVDATHIAPVHTSIHVVQQQGHAAIVDTGTHVSVPYLLAALDELGVAREAVDYILLTHVHLDHAGAAGALMKLLPNARLVVHPRGAQHMVDPTKLIAGSIAAFGEEAYQRLYGELFPISADRVSTTKDGERLNWRGRELEFVHTPGHAMHHHAIVDLDHGNIFTGDTFGMSLRQCDSERGAFIVPTTTPTQFDPEQLISSVRRLEAYQPQALFLTHYSRVTDVPRLADSMERQIREFVRIAQRHASAPDREAAIQEDLRQLLVELAAEHGCPISSADLVELFKLDLELNTGGLIAWLQRSQAQARA